MRARRRKIWTWVLTLSAVALIAVVVAVAGFRLLVKTVPGYRDDIEQRVSATLERKVTIRELDLSWRRFRPSLDLIDVTLYGDDGETPALKLRELNVGVGMLALLTANLRVADLRLAGLALTAERLEDGSLRIYGISTERPFTVEELRGIARAVDRIGRVVIADSQVLWLDYTDPNTFHRIDDIEFVLNTRGFGYGLRASAQLPAEFGGSVQLEARARGDLDKFEQLAVEAELQAQALQAGVWMEPWLRRGVTVEGGELQLQLDTRWRGARLESAAGELRSGALQLRQAGRVRPLAEDLQSEFSVAGIEGGWRLTLERLSIKAPARQAMQTQGVFEFKPASETQAFSLSGSMGQLRLHEPGEWLALFDWGEQDWLAGLKPVGHLQDLRFAYRAATPASGESPPAEPVYSLQSRFEGLGVSPHGDRPGVTGASGRLKLDASGGELMLMVRNGQILAPETFDQPFPLTELSGSLQWQREKSGWRVQSQRLRWHGPADLAGHADLELRLYDAGGSPQVNLEADFASSSWAQVRSFFPHLPVLEEDARHWIQTAIVDGRVTNGRVQLRGQLNHFPYHNPHEPGLFRIDFNVHDGVLEYAEDWPVIDRIDLHIAFQGRSMSIEAKSGRILGAPVGPVQLEVKDFYVPLLEVHGFAEADAGRMLSFLTESPLREHYSGLAQALVLKGPAKLDLRLEIPLDQLEATRASGIVTLDGKTQLNHAKLPEPITGIAGQVRFDNNGLTARDLRGELLGLQLALQLDPEPRANQNLTRLQARTEMAFPRDNAKLSRLVSTDMLARLRGRSQWHADMLFDTSATPDRLRLTSDLMGLAVNLPPPFAKAAEDALPVSVSLDPSAANGVRADVRYGNLLQAALQLRDSEDRWILERGHILLGEGNAQLPARPGLWLDGRLAEFDATLWQDILTPQPAAAAKPAPPAAPPAAPLLQQADLRFGRLRVADQVLENQRLQLTRDAGDWLLQAGGPSAEGTLRWPQKPKGRPVFRADLERLVLRPLSPDDGEETEAAEDDDAQPPRDPGALPGLSLRCRSLRVGEHELGALQLEAVPVPNGLSLATFSLTGKLDVQGSGNWMREGGESSAQLSLSARGSRLKQLFEALGYAPSLEADKIQLQSSLVWAPRAEGIKTEALGGGFSLDLENGELMAVEPGAGRVLGLLNFYALPRRLTLDFSDVVSKGLAFDTLKGDFRIEQGNAWTDNLKIRGPSLQMEIEGRVGLAARDYDQKVTIHPQVSPGVALAGTALGGPAVGLGLLLAQQLFKKPLEDISELSYRLSGPWENPSIQKAN